MATRSAASSALTDIVDRLALMEPQTSPVISLYLDLTPDQHGRDSYDIFVRKAFAEQARGYPLNSPERQSFDKDVERIRHYLDQETSRSANGLALFACSGADEFFETIQLDAPLHGHQLFIASVPHLYPLARLLDTYPRYAAVVLDSHHSRIFVFGLGSVERREEVTSEKTRRSSVGGWSQKRYQRRVDNMHADHVGEVVDALGRVVDEEKIAHIVVIGDDVVVPMLRKALPSRLSDMLVDVLTLDGSAGESQILQTTLEALRERDAETDDEHVSRLIDAWRSGGLGVAGPEATLRALELGQVDELVIAASPQALKPVQRLPADAAPGPAQMHTSEQSAPAEPQVKLSDELVTRAQRTGARMRFIENTERLAELGGVGAFLRFRV